MMELPSPVQAAVDLANERGEGVHVFDAHDRAVYSNSVLQQKLHFVDFSTRPRFADLVRSAVENGLSQIPAYSSLDEYIDLSCRLRTQLDRHAFVRPYGVAGLYMIRHERLEGYGNMQFRRHIEGPGAAWGALQEMLNRFCLAPGCLSMPEREHEEWASSFAHLLELFPEPTALLTTRGVVHTCNTAFAARCESAIGLDIDYRRGGRLTIRDRAGRREYERALSLTRRWSGGLDAMIVPIVGHGRDVVLAGLRRLRWPKEAVAVPQSTPAIVMRLIERDGRPAVLPSVVRIAYGLDDEELRFVEQFCELPDFSVAAEVLGRSENQLKALCRKILIRNNFDSPIEMVLHATRVSSGARSFNL